MLGARHYLLGAAVATVAAATCIYGHAAVVAPVRAEQRAIDFLNGLPREWARTSAKDCKTYESKNIEKLTPAFALSAARFLKAFVDIHGHVTITSAHRTAQEQACVCVGEKGPCAGKPRFVKTKKGRRIKKTGGLSRHQTGLALDVRAGTGSNLEFGCLHEFAQLNPEFGVHFPLGKRDRPHMEPARATGANVKVAALGSLRSPLVPCPSMRSMLTYEHLD